MEAQKAAIGQTVQGRAGECPEIPSDLMFYWTAYQDLATERPQGGYYAIPYFKIVEYAKVWRADFDLLKMMIWAIDSLYLKYWKDKAPKPDVTRDRRMNRANG